MKDTEVAFRELNSALASEPSDKRQRMIRLSLETGDESFWKTLAEGIGELAPREVDTFLACVREQGRTIHEDLVLKYLEIGDLATRKEAINTLAAIGTQLSTASLLERIGSEDDDINDLAIYALSQIKDPQLDQQIIEAVKNPGTDKRAEMIRLIAVRNSQGASELLNSILLTSAADPDLEEILQSTEAIGDLDSCRILLTRMLQDPPRSELRNYQLSLKRLTLRLALNELLWDNAFHPALQLASGNEIRASIVEILDCLSSEQALEYCTESSKPSKPDVLKDAAASALKRWTDINAASYWQDVLNSNTSDVTARREAKSALLRLIRASAVAGSAAQKADLALDLILEIDDEEFTAQVLSTVKDSSSVAKQFSDSIEPHGKLISQWEALD